MNVDHTKRYTLNGVHVNTKNGDVLAGRYVSARRKGGGGGMTSRLLGAAAGAAVGGPLGAALGFVLLGNRKR